MRSYCLLIVLALYVSRGRGECRRNLSFNTAPVTVHWQCGMGEENQTSCDTLDDALDFCGQQTALCSDLNITTYLNSPNATMSNSMTITSLAHFRLLGKNHVVIDCHDQGNFLLIKGSSHKVMTIEMREITFQRCGNGRAALSISGKCDIRMSKVTVSRSNGSGLLMRNVTGKVDINNSIFINNTLHGKFGAGIHINIMSIKGSSTFNISHCCFEQNQAFAGDADIPIYGGGMFISIGGATQNVTVLIIECYFSLNYARRGAGLYSSFANNASNNQLIVMRTIFQENYYHKPDDFYNAGGGASIITQDSSHVNEILFLESSFLYNNATWGGALALFSSPSTISEKLNNYTIANCTFTKNTAAVGSAISIYCKSTVYAPEFCSAVPSIVGNTTFTCNGKIMTASNNLTTSVSTVNINGFPTYIKGVLSFTNNIGSPIFVRSTAVVVTEDAQLTFYNNTAATGGGIALYDSWLAVSNGSQFIFNYNMAFAYGGAIYVHKSADIYVPHAHNCFVRYSDSVTYSPWKWGSVFNFTGNKAGTKTNSIYATSIIPCVWNNTDINQGLRETFCTWKNWNFNDPEACTEQIATSVRNFSNTSSQVHVSPGIPKRFVVGVDDLGHNNTNLTVIAMLWPQRKGYSVQYNDDGLIVSGQSNHTVKVMIQVDGDRNIFKTVNVTLGFCPPGFAYSHDTSSCQCNDNKRNFLQCHGRTFTVSLINGFCMTYSRVNHNKQTVLGRCVFSSGLTNPHPSLYIPLPDEEDKLDKEFCGLFKRTGFLCGECMDGLSIDAFSNTYDCHNCSTTVASWTTFFAIGCLPPFILFLAILLLHISFTGGAMNGFIFFCQVLTLSQEVLVILFTVTVEWHSQISYTLISILVDMCSIWSLDNYRIYHSFTQGHPVCLGENLRVIDILALHYLTALYPFALIVIAYLVIELHARNCRVLVCLWKPFCLFWSRFRRSWKPQTSLVDAFASFIILSYVKLIRISLLLVTFTNVIKLEKHDIEVVKRVNNYDPTVTFLSHQHIPFVLLGSFFFITFGLLPPIFLLFYQFKAMQKCLDRCKMNRLGLKTFMDAFQGCYKDGRNGGPDRRFFAGLYLIFRVAIFSLFNIQVPHIITYFSLVVMCIIIIILIAILQPYKVMFYNNLDILFTSVLAVLFSLHIIGFSYLETTLSVPNTIVIALVSYHYFTWWDWSCSTCSIAVFVHAL